MQLTQKTIIIDTVVSIKSGVRSMKYLKQLAVIMAVSFVGEFLNKYLPLPVPASVYGLVILFLCLVTKVIRLEQVEDTGNFLLKIMPVFFIAPCASLITVIGGIADKLFLFAVICIVSTVVVMAVTGLVAQAILKRKADKEEEKHE